MGTIHRKSIRACEIKAEYLAHYGMTVNVGGGQNDRWTGALNIDAKLSGIDFNTQPIPIQDCAAYVVVCEQVIEHLHNTTFFLSELNRILRIGGQLLISTENLASIPNRLASLFGIAPFSVQPICGEYVGGFKRGVFASTELPTNHPAYSGVLGHVRVLTAGQLSKLLSKAGFTIVGKRGFCGSHYILFDCRKIK